MTTSYIALRSPLFVEDITRLKAEGRSLDPLDAVTALLVNGTPLPNRYDDHALTGPWHGCRGLHLSKEPDWIMIYQYIGRRKIRFLRTASHRELFQRGTYKQKKR